MLLARQQLAAVLQHLRDDFPAICGTIERSLHETIPQTIGALCMTRNGCHPLMWAHYADEHRGAVIEFDATASCFARQGFAEGVGSFVDVHYATARPTLNKESEDQWLRVLALTKAND
jgi:hypothetical protein